jgi:hypothetical protein
MWRGNGYLTIEQQEDHGEHSTVINQGEHSTLITKYGG